MRDYDIEIHYLKPGSGRYYLMHSSFGQLPMLANAYLCSAAVASGGIFAANLFYRVTIEPRSPYRPDQGPIDRLSDFSGKSAKFIVGIGLKSLAWGSIWPLTVVEYGYRLKYDTHYKEIYYPFYTSISSPADAKKEVDARLHATRGFRRESFK